jgi:hypothetical protein
MSRLARARLVSFALPLLLSMSTSVPAETPARAIAATVKKPMLFVSRLVTQEKLAPNIDEILRNAPSAKALGAKWDPSNPAWEKARAVITRRIDRIADLYGDSDDFAAMLQSEIDRTAPGETSVAMAKMLSSPAGPSILRSQGMIQFISTVMADDPNGPKVGDPAWRDQMSALSARFKGRAATAFPADDPAHASEVQQYFRSADSAAFRNLWNGVVGKAGVKLDGAVNLIMFDDREAIQRELDAAIATAK